MTPVACPGCGARFESGFVLLAEGDAALAGRRACQATFEALLGRAMSDPRYAGAYRMAFDAYCMQHVERYCVSARSYAAHLAFLCWGLEGGGARAGYSAIQRWLSGPRGLEMPPILPARGSGTVLDAYPGRDPADHARQVRRWAESVWTAYEPQHELARAVVREALGAAKAGGARAGDARGGDARSRRWRSRRAPSGLSAG